MKSANELLNRINSKLMCGILATINSTLDENRFLGALKKMTHRGPDGIGTYFGQNVFLGHTRLSIIDLETGQQPLFNEDESIILVCNGEIYDFEKIRADLINLGHKFKTHSDSEVIIHLYEEYGMDFFRYLRGEFAFILFDRNENLVLACRDRFGIKPLYFADKNEQLVLSSEIKSIFATGLVKAQIDVEAVRNLSCLINKGSVFQDINPLPPATYLIYRLDQKKFEIKKYWDLDLENYEEIKCPLSFDEMKNKVLEKFDESVKLRLRADVPVGVYLSGGLDSSAIAGTIAKYSKNQLQAFSIAFADDSLFNESSLARETAAKIGANYHELVVTKKLLLENLEECLWYAEGPCSNLHGVGKFLLSKMAVEHVKVVLTGEGGDELFLGYDYFKDNKNLSSFANLGGRKLNRKDGPLKRKRLEKIRKYLGFDPLPEMADIQSPLSQYVVNKIFLKKYQSILKRNTSLNALKMSLDESQLVGRDRVAQSQYFSIRSILANYILSMLGDRQEMAHSLEGRTPLLDHQLFELCKSIPLSFKIKDGQEKYIFKEALKERLTQNVYERKKWPYFAPIILVAKGDNPQMDLLIEKYLTAQAINQAGIFDYRMVKRLMFYVKCFKIFPMIQTNLNSLLTFILSVQILNRKFVIENGD